jgi:glucokinase
LADVIELAKSLQMDEQALAYPPIASGIGVAELVDRHGQILSQATIAWRGVPVAERVRAATSLPTIVDADVRAAARAEGILGAGRSFDPFLYVTVGTGISACLVVAQTPYEGSGGLTGTFASGRCLFPNDQGTLMTGPPLEDFAAGPGIAARYRAAQPGFSGTAKDVLALAEQGDQTAESIVETSARALGAAVANLVNILDPQAVVLGGGLGLAGGSYRHRFEATWREFVWSDLHRDIRVCDAELGVDAGWIGAAIKAWVALA